MLAWRLMRAEGEFAERTRSFPVRLSGRHSWVKKLDLSKVDFGKGKRMLVRGGRFDSKYNITVPELGGERSEPGGRV